MSCLGGSQVPHVESSMPHYTMVLLLACPCVKFEGYDEPCIMQKCLVCLSYINEMSVSYEMQCRQQIGCY